MQAADSTIGGQQNVLLHGSMASSDDRYSSSAKHRTLVPPNAFNVSTLFQPTLSFIERASAIVPPGFEDETNGFGSVLEDFVVKVFLPQLDEKVTSSFQQAVQGMFVLSEAGIVG
jgi:exocyst complex component 4